MKKLDTFIFVHDQNIILDFKEKNKFSELDGFRYVFLGNKPHDLIKNFDNVIIASDLEYNIEQYPKLTSFTGWYALHKNNLIDSEYVNFFEYDVNYVDRFADINKKLVNVNLDFIGYFPMLVTDPVYLTQTQYTDKLIDAIKLKTGVDVNNIVKRILNKDRNTVWSSSSNSTWRVSALKDYIDWFINFIDDIKDSSFCGHMHERSLSIYYFIMGLKVEITQGLMSHFQLNSHGTSPLPPERGKELYKMLR